MAIKISGVQLGIITGGPSSINLSDLHDVSISSPLTGQYLRYNSSISEWQNAYLTSDVFDYLNSSLSGTQGVTITATSGPNTIAVGLGAITPTSVASTGSVTGTNLSGTNTGDQTITLTGDITGSGTGSFATTLATVNSSPQTDTFRRITVNGKGLVTASSAVGSSDITTALGYTPVNLAGDTMTGLLLLSGDPVASAGAATKNYVDNAITGNTWKQAVNLLSVTNFPLTGTWASITAGIDSHPLSVTNVGYRILLTGQTTGSQDGIYVLTDAGSGNYALVRSADADTYQELIGASVFVMEGTVYTDTGWVQSNHYLTSFSGQTWVQFTGGGSYTGGTGISVSGNVISNTGVLSVTAGSGISVTPSSTGAITITATGGSGTVTSVNIIPPSAGISASGGPITTSGSITLALTNDLAAVEGLSTTGIAVRSATDTWLTRSVAVSGTGLSITNADGVSGNPTITSNATNANTASTIVARDASGNFVAGTITAALTGAASANVLKAGDTMTGLLLLSGDPTVALGAATKQYVDANSGSSTINTITYDNRGTLRSIVGSANMFKYVESLGMFVWTAGSTEPDDDETAFVSTGGVWLLATADPEFVYESQLLEDQDLANANFTAFTDDRTFFTSTNGDVFTTPDNVFVIRAYLFGAGGGFSGTGGGGGACSWATIPTIPGRMFSFDFNSTAAYLSGSQGVYLTANSANFNTGGAAGYAPYEFGMYNSGSSSGGTTVNSAGASSGSPLGNGFPGVSGGGGWGGTGSASGGAGGTGGAGAVGGGGAGGASVSYVGGIGRDYNNLYTDPLLRGCISPGGSAPDTNGGGASAGPGGGGSYGAVAGGNGGRGGGGGGGGQYGGHGGFGGGGGTGTTAGGNGGTPGGGSGGGTTGSAGVLIFY